MLCCILGDYYHPFALFLAFSQISCVLLGFRLRCLYFIGASCVLKLQYCVTISVITLALPPPHPSSRIPRPPTGILHPPPLSSALHCWHLHDLHL